MFTTVAYVALQTLQSTVTMITIRQSHKEETSRLFEIWHNAVAATHGFIAPHHLAEIEQMVKTEYLPGKQFWVAADEDDRAVGFMRLDGDHLDSLFVDPAFQGQGIGLMLVKYAHSLSPKLSVEVNEQNLEARQFYEKLGFVKVGWAPKDEGGRPYPLLMMHLKDGKLLV